MNNLIKKLYENLKPDSQKKFQEIQKLIKIDENFECPNILFNFFNVFYDNFNKKKKIYITSSTNIEISNFKNNAKYIFEETQLRYDDFLERYNKYDTKTLNFLDYPLLKLTVLKNDINDFEIANSNVTLYKTIENFNEILSVDKEIIEYMLRFITIYFKSDYDWKKYDEEKKEILLNKNSDDVQLNILFNNKISPDKIKENYNDILSNAKTKTVLFIDKPSISKIKKKSFFEYVIDKKQYISNYNSKFKRELRIKDLKYNDKPDDILINYYNESIGFAVGGVTNTGVLYSFSGTEEERQKIFFHEITHFLDYDIDKFASFKLKYCTNQNVSCESLTEFMAILFHIVYICSRLKKLYELNDEQCKNLFSYIIYIEQLWSNYVVSKILYLYGYRKHNIDDFFSNKENCKEIKYNNIEILSYYFGKSLLLFNINEILVDTYFEKNLKAKEDFFYNIQNKIYDNPSKEYINNIKNNLEFIDDELKKEKSDITNSVGYICFELNNRENDQVKEIIVIDEEKENPDDIFKRYFDKTVKLYSEFINLKGGHKKKYKLKKI